MQISEIREIIAELSKLPDTLSEVLMNGPYIKQVAKKYSSYEHMFVL